MRNRPDGTDSEGREAGWQFPEDAPRTERYYHAVGKFILAFGSAEKMAFSLLGVVANLDVQSSAAILSGYRADSIVSGLRRLLKAKDMSQLANDLEPMLGQFAVINGLRNDILHRWNKFNDGDEIVLSNYWTAITEEKLEESPLPLGVIEQATSDLGQIWVRLALVMLTFRTTAKW